MLKTNSDMAEARHRDAGITSYVWRTVRDSRVRGRPGGVWADSDENHWRLEGTVHRYDDPPVIQVKPEVRGKPGDLIGCRCRARPVVNFTRMVA